MTEAAETPRTPRATDWHERRVADAMHAGAITCPPETPLRSVADLMATHRIHSVVVMGHGEEFGFEGRLWGVVSDLDLIRAAGADLRTPPEGRRRRRS